MAFTQGEFKTRPNGSRHSTQARPRHHNANFPPKCLADMTRADMDLLAPLFLPFKGTETDRPHYGKSLKKNIASLPPHLKANGLTFLSDLCSLHSKLSPFLTTNIFNTIRTEIDNDIATFWEPMAQNGQLSQFKCELIRIAQNLSALWLGPQHFKQRYGRNPRLSVVKGKKLTTCAACLLTSMADLQILLALSSLLIGRIPSSVWPLSKRVQWYEAWILSFTKDEKEKYRELMWNVGKLMREARILARQGKPKTDESGQEIGKVTAKLHDIEPASKRPSRPPISPSQDDDVAHVNGTDVAPKRPSRPPRSPSQDSDVNFVKQQEAEAETEDSEWDGYGDDDQATTPRPKSTTENRPQPRRTASSVYSRAIDADTRSKFFRQQGPIETEVDDILSLYRHSNIFPDDFGIPPFDHDAPPVPRVPSILPEPIRRRPLPLQELPQEPLASVMGSGSTVHKKKSPSQALQNVTIPRKISLTDSIKAQNWKGKFTDRAPRLRMSKNGTIKGPFDPDSSPSDASPMAGKYS